MDTNLYCKWLILLFVMVITVRKSTASSGDSEWRETIVTGRGYDRDNPIGVSCGYPDRTDKSYYWKTAAVSTALFNEGYSCGHCFDIRCDPVKSTNCTDAGIYTVKAADICPPDRAGGWFSSPKVHFDLNAVVIMQMTLNAYVTVDTLPVFYRRAPCKMEGGLMFQLTRSNGMVTVTVMNVAGVGEVKSLDVRSEYTPWVKMRKSRPTAFESFRIFQGQIISFRATSGTGQTVEAINCVPHNWSPGGIYESNVNFDDSMPDSFNLSMKTFLS